MLDSHSQQVTAGRLQLGGLSEGGGMSAACSSLRCNPPYCDARPSLPSSHEAHSLTLLRAPLALFSSFLLHSWVRVSWRDGPISNTALGKSAMTVLGGVIGHRSSEPGGGDEGLGFRRSLMRRLGLVGAARGDVVDATACRLSKWANHGFDSPTPNPRYLNCFANKNSLLRHDRTQAARDLWLNKLTEVISAEREKEPRTTNIQVVYYDLATNIEYVSKILIIFRFYKPILIFVRIFFVIINPFLSLSYFFFSNEHYLFARTYLLANILT